MRILYQFPLSPYCEKARWLLDHKELDYVAQNLVPGLHRIKMQLHSKQSQLPVLQDGMQWIADSSQIALYLDQHYPEHSLQRKDPQLQQQIMQIDALSQRLGRHVRRCFYFYLLNQPKSKALEIMLGEKGLLHDYQKLALAALKLSLKQLYNINPARVEHSLLQLDQLCLALSQQLASNGGRYMVGDQLSLADIAVCSMLAPLLMIEGTPWEQDFSSEDEGQRLAKANELRELPLGQYVLRIYAQERNARVDWRGI